MKKLIVCFVALAMLGLSSCKKDDPEPEPYNPATEFVGAYTVSTEAHLQVPVLGAMDMPLSDMDAEIVLNGNNGEVNVTMSGQTTTGYVNSTGMHLDPIILNETIYNMDVAITVTFPVIPKPVDGVTSWVATLSAVASVGTITGTADMTAVRKN